MSRPEDKTHFRVRFKPSFLRNLMARHPSAAKIVGNAGWLFVDKVLRLLTGLTIGIWLARYLGPNQYGLLNFALAFVALFSSLSTLGLPGVVVRNLVQEPSKYQAILGTAAMLLLAAGLVTYACLIGTTFLLYAHETALKTIIAIVGITTIFKFTEVIAFWFESQTQSRYVVWAQCASLLISSSVKAVLIWLDASVTAFAGAVLLEGACLTVLMFVTYSFFGPTVKALKYSYDTAVHLMKDSWPWLLSSLAVTAYMKIDQVMLGQLLGEEAVGIYSAATRLSEIWYFVPLILVASVSPAIFKAKRQSARLYQDHMQRLYALMVWLALPLSLALSVVAKQLVVMAFGPAYADSGTVLAIHIWASVFVFWGVANNQWLLAESLHRLAVQRTVLGLFINVSLNLLLIPRFGVSGAATATVISQCCVGLLFDALQRRTHPMFWMKIKALNPMSLRQGSQVS